MQQFDFLKNKYGKELLVDLGRVESLDRYILSRDLHFITFYEVVVITEGTGFYSLDNEKIAFTKGTIMVSLPYQVRRWRVEKPLKGFSFFFEGEFLNTYFRDDLFLNRFAIFDYNKPTFAIQLEKEKLEKCLWGLHEVELEFQGLKGDSSHILRSLLYYLISLIDRFYRQQHGLEKIKGHSVIYRFKKLLNKHIYDWHTVAEYAEALNVSHNHLNKLCKENLLTTASELIHRRLMLEAKREIQFSARTVSEIAHALNFSDVSNFNRFFKRMAGKTPSQYKSDLTIMSEN